MWWDCTKFQYTFPPLNQAEIEAQRAKELLIAQEKSKQMEVKK
jgi:hypothetical protein